MRAPAAGVMRFNAGLWGLTRSVAETLGLPSVAQFASRASQVASRLAERVAGSREGAGPIEQAVLSGAESAGAAAPALALGAATGSPAVTLAVMGATTGGEAYQRARKQGLSHERALVYGALDGIVEAATELIPAHRLLGDIAANAGLRQIILRQLASEIPGEQAATILQDANAWANLPENKDKPLSKFLEERPEAMVQTLIATIVGSLTQTGGAVAVGRLAGRVQRPTTPPPGTRPSAPEAAPEAAAVAPEPTPAPATEPAPVSPEEAAARRTRIREAVLSGLPEIVRRRPLPETPETAAAPMPESEPTPTEQAVAEPEWERHEYASTQVNLPPDVSDRIRELGARIPNEDLAADGRETEPHITVQYGIENEDVEALRAALADERPITVTFGKTSLFENEDADVLKVDVESDDLHRVRAKIAEAVGAPGDTYPEYVPHATVAYVKPGRGKAYVGDASLEGQTATIDRLTFSLKDGSRIEIPLGGQGQVPEAGQDDEFRRYREEAKVWNDTVREELRPIFQKYFPNMDPNRWTVRDGKIILTKDPYLNLDEPDFIVDISSGKPVITTSDGKPHKQLVGIIRDGFNRMLKGRPDVRDLVSGAPAPAEKPKKTAPPRGASSKPPKIPKGYAEHFTKDLKPVKGSDGNWYFVLLKTNAGADRGHVYKVEGDHLVGVRRHQKFGRGEPVQLNDIPGVTFNDPEAQAAADEWLSKYPAAPTFASVRDTDSEPTIASATKGRARKTTPPPGAPGEQRSPNVDESPAVKRGDVSREDAYVLRWFIEDLREMSFQQGGGTPRQRAEAFARWRPGDPEHEKYGIGIGTARVAGTPLQKSFEALGVSASRRAIADDIERYLTGRARKLTKAAEAAKKLAPIYRQAWDPVRKIFDFERVVKDIAQLGLRRRDLKGMWVGPPAQEQPADLADYFNGTTPEAVKARADADVADPDRIETLIYQYNQRRDFGNIVSTDQAKELWAPYAESNAGRTRYNDAVADAANRVAIEVYRRRLQAEPGFPGEVLITGGGPGAGKTTVVSRLEDAPVADVIFDTVGSGLEATRQRIQEALDSGRTVTRVFVYRDPVDAWVAAMRRAKQSGRPVTIDGHVLGHKRAIANAVKLAEEFADDPRVRLMVIDNTGEATHVIPKEDGPAFLQGAAEAYNEANVRAAIQAETDEAHAAGDISDDLYRAFTREGRATPEAGGASDRRAEAGSRGSAEGSVLPEVSSEGEVSPPPGAPGSRRRARRRYTDKTAHPQDGGRSEKLEGAFLDRREVKTTGVATRLLIIDKPQDTKTQRREAPGGHGSDMPQGQTPPVRTGRVPRTERSLFAPTEQEALEPLGQRALDVLRAVELPELVALARELMQTPGVVKRFRKEGKRGEFHEGKGIRLHADLFKKGNEVALAKTLAHEIGHLVDWLPTRTLKRGNILGHLLTLRKYLNHTFTAHGGEKIHKNEVRDELIALSKMWRGDWVVCVNRFGTLPCRPSSRIRRRTRF